MKKVRAKTQAYTLEKTADPRLRPALSHVSVQMKAWSSALAAEVAEWPGATARSYFGFTALYRGKNIFGALPRTRAFGEGNRLAFRIDDLPARLKSKVKSDRRLGFIDKKNTRWFTFELSSDSDIHGALEWLADAYRSAASKRRKSNE